MGTKFAGLTKTYTTMTKPIVFFAVVMMFGACGSKPGAPQEAKKEEPVKGIPETEIVDPMGGKVEIEETLPTEEITAVRPSEEKAGTKKPGKPGETKQAAKPGTTTLHGSWVLEKVYGAKEPFKILFPGKIPTVTFDLKTNRLNGNNGCNSYNGPFELKAGVLKISDMVSTKMFCQGVSESLFMTTLKMADSYAIDAEGHLDLMLGGEKSLRFKPE